MISNLKKKKNAVAVETVIVLIDEPLSYPLSI